MRNTFVIFFLIFFVFVGCNNQDDFYNPEAVRLPPRITVPIKFADVNLNQQTISLYNRLLNITQTGIAFGQQEPFGTGNNFPVENKLEQDFFEVTNDYPAIAGFDLELIALQPEGESLDNFIKQFADKVLQAHKNGSIITFTWHMVETNIQQPNAGNFNNVVTGLLTGGIFREEFLKRLERAATLFKNLVDAQGNPIPVLFRPWHEMNGDFFFWGEGFRTTDQYKQLWRDTVKILSEDFDVHNLIYVYAPNFVGNRSEYLRNYPGDAFVDMLGIDVYDFRNRKFVSTAIKNLKIVEEIATEKNMLFALTETGLTNIVDSTWWTGSLYKAIRNSSITYAMIWRNDKTTFFHAPFLGHPAVDNFNEFLDKEVILLSKDIL